MTRAHNLSVTEAWGSSGPPKRVLVAIPSPVFIRLTRSFL